MKKVADLYVRVSTEEQANSGYSQRHQEEMLRRYCSINSIEVRKVIYEDHSAKSFERPEWKKMLAEYRKHKGLIDCILFLKWDRFSRNAGDSYAMLSTLQRLGIEAQAIEQPLDLSIPENKLMLAFFLAAPEVENARRALNVIHGMRRAQKEGRVMGIAPKGYSNKINENGRKYITPKQPEAAIVQWVFEEVATGGRGTILELWKQAKEKGLNCSQSNFYTILQNPVYCGKVLIPAYQNEECTIVQGTHEPLISEVLFYTVQDILHGRKKPRAIRQAVREEYPLRNFLVCPKCGRFVTASCSKGHTKYYSYYHCVAACGWRYKAEYIHDTFLQELRKYMPLKQMLEFYKGVILDIYNNQQEGSKNEKKALLRDINEQNNRLTKARELLLSETIDSGDYKIIKAECERKINLFEAKLAATAPQQQDIETLLDKALYNLAHLDTNYQIANIQEKRQIISSIFPEKLVFENNAYRTPRINEAVQAIYNIDKAFRGIKKGKDVSINNLSCQVASPRIELGSKV